MLFKLLECGYEDEYKLSEIFHFNVCMFVNAF